MPGATIGIVTTSSLPWLTGSSIMPLFQAVYLNKRGYETTLYLPWLPPAQQHHCFPDHVFETPEAQHDYVINWLPDNLRAFCPDIRFYPAKYYASIESIGPLVDLNRLVDDHRTVILEGPEHLFASHPWSRFKRSRSRVIGVVMTHYQYYHRQHIPAFLARWYQGYSRFLMKRTSHQIVALAPVQKDVCALPICLVSPLNAVDPQFFKPPPAPRTGGGYFIGKLIPEKGLEEMFLNLQAAGETEIDLYGAGRSDWVRQAADRHGVRPVLKGVSYRPWDDLPRYKIFVNCSRSEYLCTTTANALVMGQWAIVPEHPSNEFYARFRTCLTYASLDEFIKQFDYARTHQPEVDPRVTELSWEAATDRLADIMERPINPAPGTRKA